MHLKLIWNLAQVILSEISLIWDIVLNMANADIWRSIKWIPKKFGIRGRTQTTWPFLGHFLTSPPPQMSRVFRKFSGILLYTNNRHRELVKNVLRNLYFSVKQKSGQKTSEM